MLETPFEPLALPQNDTNPKRRSDQLLRAQDAHAYTYDKPNVRGLAMCAQVPKSDGPTAAWIVSAAKAVAGLAANIAGQVAAMGEGASEAESAASVQSGLKAAGIDGAKSAMEQAFELAKTGMVVGRGDEMADFARQFQHYRVPDIASDLHLDSTFARMRVAGSNPAWITQVDPGDGLPDDFGVTAEHYREAIGSQDSLEAALAEGRLFISEYRQLLGATPGCSPVPGKIEVDYQADPEAWDAAYAAREAAYSTGGATPKVLTAPLALFAVTAGGRSLAPVAIQLFPNGWRGETYPVFTPRDGAAWQGAKSCVQVADGNVHQAISHLGLTHLVQEAFAQALHNCLAPRHPLNRLLEPHFQGTQLINAAADSSLVAPAGAVDKVIGPTIGDVVAMTAAARNEFDFNANMFPRLLESRGVADASVLPHYPYRDDGLLVWGALEAWVRTYVQHYYRNDADVIGDIELQGFVAQLGQYKVADDRGRLVGGGVKGVGEDGPRIVTRGYLTQMLTQIIWNGSAQHAAVNFPQAELMSYAPAYPLHHAGASPAGSGRFTDPDYLRQLPDLQSANLQLVLGQFLGGLHASKLGHYGRRGPAPWFTDKAVRGLESDFHGALDRIEETITDRNRSRPRYGHLRPSLIPQSIDI